MTVQDQITADITNNKVVLYMKGTPDMPQCGFSSMAVQILRLCQVDTFHSVNVLADENIREGIKEYSDWPTIPQLYIDGTFIGGCDIMREMYEEGELQDILS